MAKRNVLKLDTKSFDEYAEKLDRLGADLKPIFARALEQAAETVEKDTIDAVQDPNLPAGGKYHGKNRDTEKSIMRNSKVKWSGFYGEIRLGFDFGKPGAGGYLISGRGTPRKMRPVKQLKDIYKGKKYMSDIKQSIVKVFEDEIHKRMR